MEVAVVIDDLPSVDGHVLAAVAPQQPPLVRLEPLYALGEIVRLRAGRLRGQRLPERFPDQGSQSDPAPRRHGLGLAHEGLRQTPQVQGRARADSVGHRHPPSAHNANIDDIRRTGPEQRESRSAADARLTLFRAPGTLLPKRRGSGSTSAEVRSEPGGGEPAAEAEGTWLPSRRGEGTRVAPSGCSR